MNHTELKRLAIKAAQVKGLWFTKQRLANILGNTQDAEFVAAASPDVVIAILDELAEAQKERDVFRKIMDDDADEIRTLTEERDTLQSKVAAMESQEPYHWMVPNFQIPFPDQLSAQRYLNNMGFEEKPIPLYLAPGAAPKEST